MAGRTLRGRTHKAIPKRVEYPTLPALLRPQYAMAMESGELLQLEQYPSRADAEPSSNVVGLLILGPVVFQIKEFFEGFAEQERVGGKFIANSR